MHNFTSLRDISTKKILKNPKALPEGISYGNLDLKVNIRGGDRCYT